MPRTSIGDRFKLTYQAASYRRVIAGKEVIIHCHHYNSRLQNTIEGAAKIDGKQVIKSSAQASFAAFLSRAIKPSDSQAERYAVATALYGYLGFGQLDLSNIDK